MSCLKYLSALGLAALLFLIPAANAQTERPLTWQQDLDYLQNLSAADVNSQQGNVARIHTEVENWLKLHPTSKVTLKVAPPRPWSAEQTGVQVQELRVAVKAILQEDPNRPFHLGVTEINVAESASPLQPSLSSLTESVDHEQIADQNLVNVTKALDVMPGVEVQHASGQRNEAKFSIRGFSSTGQVPMYVDGIPVTIPYDSNLDINRFLTTDVAEVQVSRGVSSPLLGPNSMGGAINLVTREPRKRFEGDALIGTGSGNGLLSSLRLGTHSQRYFAQGTLDWDQADYVPLSENFRYPAGGYTALNTSPNVQYPLTDEMNHSDFRDEKWSGRVGWTPRGQDEYVFSYINQKGQKGAPLYMGPFSSASFKNFWSWPYWNKNSYYFLSNTGIGEKSSLKTRVYYDQFRNSIDMWDNSTYSTMSGANSEHSKYDEHADGATADFTTKLISRNSISGSFFFKDDTHRERGIYHPDSVSGAVTQPWLVDRSQLTSIGVQDIINITSRLLITAGFSGDHLNGLQAQQYLGSSPSTTLGPFTCVSNTTNTSNSGCTDHVWSYNPQVSASYTITQSDRIFVTFADRSRFPILKELYSYKMRTGIPNPDLNPEHSRNWNIGYSRAFGGKTTAQVELFRSDLRDAIQQVYVPDPTGTMCPSNTGSYAGMCSQFTNVSKAAYEGVEVEVRSRPVSILNLDVSYSYLNRSYDYFTVFPGAGSLDWQMAVNGFRAGLPRNKVVGNALIRLPHGVEGMISARYEGGDNIQDSNDPTTVTSPTSGKKYPSYYIADLATMDLGVKFPIYKTFIVQSGLKNVFDRNYYYTAGFPEAGRNWFLNLRYSF